jgi:hypothetical protein
MPMPYGEHVVAARDGMTRAAESQNRPKLRSLITEGNRAIGGKRSGYTYELDEPL